MEDTMSFDSYYGTAGIGSVELTSGQPAFTEPLTVDEVKGFLKLPARTSADPSEDAIISSLITAARACAEVEQGRDLVRKQWDLTLDYWPGTEVLLGDPLVSIDLITYKDSGGVTTTMTQDTDYIIDSAPQPAVLRPPYNRTWPFFLPWPSGAILIRFTAGYDTNAPFWMDIGAHVKLGMRLLITDWFYNRLPVEPNKGQAPVAFSLLAYGGRRRAL